MLYARKQALKTVTGVSPTGGINSVAALSQMQPDECVQLENLWPGAFGATSRLGSAVHTQDVGYYPAISTFTPPTSATATCVISGHSFTATHHTDADTTVNDLIALIQANPTVSALVTVTLVSHKMQVTAKALGASGNGITTTSNNANGASFDHASTQGGISSTSGNYTLIPFHGEDGTHDKLFVATNQGLWDCSVTGAVPTLLLAFAATTGLAGIGSSTNFSSIGDHFCVYCDEVNGYYLYTESTQTWQRVGTGTPSTSVYTPPTAATATCVINGTTFVATFDTDAGTTIANLMAIIRSDDAITALVKLSSDGSLMTVTAVEPGTAGNGITTTTDGANGAAFSAAATTGGTDGVYGVNPNDFVFPCVWMRRLWFCERGSSTGWFLPFDSVFGEAKPFNFGASQPAGGALKCMANWTVDSGNGVGNNLIVISEAGNVSVYSGSDPEVTGAFLLTGVWFVGGFPVGRNISAGDGGDVIIITNLGVMSLAHYLQGLSLADRTLYATKNIQTLIQEEVQENGNSYGWQIVITPDEQAIIIVVPQPNGMAPICYGAPYATRNWCKLTGRSAFTMGVWLNKLYFVEAGTVSDLYEVNGSLDFVQLDGSGGQPIPWTVFGSFQPYGTPAVRKRVQMLRPYFTTTGSTVNYSIAARYDYDLTPPPPATTPSTLPAGSLWDTAVWDVALWSSGTASLFPFQQLNGATGEGHVVAVALTGYAIEPTTLVQVDVMYEEGNYF